MSRLSALTGNWLILAAHIVGLATQARAAVDLGGSYVAFPSHEGQVCASPSGQNQHATGEFTIVVRLMSSNGISVANYPRDYIVLNGGEGDLHNCLPRGHVVRAFAIADANTDANGYTTFTVQTPFYCGGQLAAGEDSFLVLANDNAGGAYDWVVLGSSRKLSIRTPDFDGDGIVGLADSQILAATLYGVYDRKADLNFDNLVNLSDLSLFASGYGTACP